MLHTVLTQSLINRKYLLTTSHIANNSNNSNWSTIDFNITHPDLSLVHNRLALRRVHLRVRKSTCINIALQKSSTFAKIHADLNFMTATPQRIRIQGYLRTLTKQSEHTSEPAESTHKLVGEKFLKWNQVLSKRKCGTESGHLAQPTIK